MRRVVPIIDHLEPTEAERERLAPILGRHVPEAASLVPLLQEVQAACGYLPRTILPAVARHARVPLSQVYGLATFYAHFSLRPRGRRTLRICQGTACHVRGAPVVLAEFVRRLGLEPGETSPDGEFTLERVACVGACGLAPIAMVGDEAVGRLDVRKAGALARRLLRKGNGTAEASD